MTPDQAYSQLDRIILTLVRADSRDLRPPTSDGHGPRFAHPWVIELTRAVYRESVRRLERPLAQ